LESSRLSETNSSLTKELSVFSQNDQRELKITSGKWFHSSKFFIMLIGVVVGPLVLIVIGGRSLNTLGEPGLVWSSVAITLLLLISIVIGIRMFFRRVANDLSISPKYKSTSSERVDVKAKTIHSPSSP
jgi:hypothetical protein